MSLEFCDHYKDFSQLYTDGSKMGNEAAAAVVHGNVANLCGMQSNSSCPPHINYNIHYSSKDYTSPEIYRNKLFEFCDHYKDFSQLYK